MSTTKTSTQVPKLRFPGFEGEWSQVALGEATKVIDCKHRTPQYVEAGVPIISPGTIKWGPLDTVTPTKRVTEEEYVSLMDHCDPQMDDLVLSRNQSMGIASRIRTREKFVLGQDTVLIQQRNDNGGIIFFRLQTEGTQVVIGKLSGGSTFSRINLKDIRQLPLVLPTERDEQQKIAAFLTAVDERIEQLSRKKALLEATKKGVMQQLFTQTLRFQDDHGHDFPDWEEKTLGDVCSVVTSGSRDWAQYYSEHGAKFVRMTNLPRYGIHLLLDDMKYVSLPKGGHEGARTSLQGHDILISITAELGKIGWVPEGFGEAYINQHTALVRPVRHVVDSKYLAYVLATPDSHKRLNRLNDSGAKAGLNLATIREFELPVPSLPEQTKIAGFLSALDGKIAAVGEQLSRTQAWKKGLLQQMFV